MFFNFENKLNLINKNQDSPNENSTLTLFRNFKSFSKKDSNNIMILIKQSYKSEFFISNLNALQGELKPLFPLFKKQINTNNVSKNNFSIKSKILGKDNNIHIYKKTYEENRKVDDLNAIQLEFDKFIKRYSEINLSQFSAGNSKVEFIFLPLIIIINRFLIILRF